jgi:PAS domain S-box-containing protein
VNSSGAPEGFDPALLEEDPNELYEQAPCGYVSTFPNGVFAKVNQTFLDWTGYTRGELLRVKRFQDLLTSGGRIFYDTHYTPLLHMQGFVHEIALDLVCHDGRRLPTLVNALQKRDAAGRPLLHRATIFNASARRQYERELLLARKQAEQAADRMSRLQAVMGALAEAITPAQVVEVITQRGVAARDAQAGLVAVVSEDNKSLEIVYAVGYPAEAPAKGQRFPLHTSLPLADAVREEKLVLLESPEAVASYYPQLALLAERTGNHSLAAIPLSVHGHTLGVLVLSFATVQSFPAQDHAFLLTLGRQCALALERAHLYEAERRARAEAQEALQIRNAFLSTASHELKTPLTSLLGNAQLLQRREVDEGSPSPREQRRIAVIIDQATRLNKLISTLLDVSHMGSGRLSIERVSLDLNALIGRIVADLQPTLTQHTLVLRSSPEPLKIEGDALRLEQVVHNLLQNAIKYSPSGGPVIVQLEQRGQMACVAVIDQGIGIAAEELPHLFERFYRGTNLDTSGIKGLGVGLYVVKEIVTAHGGTVTVESTKGEGSTFTVCLPLSAPS